MIERYTQRIIELELQLEYYKRKLNERDLEIVGLNHDLMVLRESMRCDPSECLEYESD